MTTTKPPLTIASSNRQQILIDAMNSHRPQLLAVIRRIVRDQAEAEDILQDVFEEYIETYDLGKAIETVGAWLIQVAKNKTLDRWRRNKTVEKHVDEEIVSKNHGVNPSSAEDAQTFEMRDEILEALSLLPEDQRDVFIGHELEGKSFEEISQETGIGINTLLSKKRYAILFLRNYLKEIYDGLDN